MRSIDEQIDAMERRYPNLHADIDGERSCVWQGRHRQYHKQYTLKIGYCVPLIVENATVMSIQPRVQVLQPMLERHRDYDEGPIPHVYGNPDDSFLPFLCLFDPHSSEWSTSDLVAHTTVPWAERWLLNYEFWLATGKWEGGGRHIASLVEDDLQRNAAA